MIPDSFVGSKYGTCHTRMPFHTNLLLYVFVFASLDITSQQEHRLFQKAEECRKNDSRRGGRRGAEVEKRGGKRRSGWVREAPPGARCYISSPLSGTGQRGWRAKRNGGRGAKDRGGGGGGERRFNNLWWEERKCTE